MIPLAYTPASSSDVPSSVRRERTRAETAEAMMVAAALLLGLAPPIAERYAADAIEMLTAFRDRKPFPEQ